MPDYDGATDILDRSGNGKGVALNVYPDSSLQEFANMQTRFGAVGDGITNDTDAILGAIDELDGNLAGYTGSARLYFPPGIYKVSDDFNIRSRMIMEGDGPLTSRLVWDTQTSGIRVGRVNTTDATTGSVSAFTVGGGDQATIRFLGIEGAYAGVEGEFHGVELRAAANLEQLIVKRWPGDGIYSNTIAGDPTLEGNSSLADITLVHSFENRKGLFFDGADSNVCNIWGGNYTGNRQWGIDDSSFLGNNYYGPHIAANGWDGAMTSIPTACTFGGNRYYVKAGQAVGASTNAPTGTTADNTWWGYIAAGGVYNGIVPWVSGTIFREGGAFKTDNANARNMFIGVYTEPDQNPAQIGAPTEVAWGHHGAGVKGTGTWRTNSNTGLENFLLGGMQSVGGANISALLSGRVEFSNATNQLTLEWFDNILALTALRSGIPANQAFQINGDGSQTFLGDRRLNFPNGYGLNDKKMLPGTAAPVAGTYKQGDMVFNSTPSAGGPMGWVCVTDGSPGTWKAMANLAP